MGILNTSSESQKHLLITEYRVAFKINRGNYFKFLISQTTKLLGSTKSKITKDQYGENVLHLEIAEVVLAHCKFLTTIMNKI